MRVAADLFSRNSPHSDGGNGHSCQHHPPRVSNDGPRLYRIPVNRKDNGPQTSDDPRNRRPIDLP